MPEELKDKNTNVYLCGKGELHDNFCAYRLENNEHIVYQLSTGLIDSKNKEIFEGDYVQWLVDPLWLRYEEEFKKWEKEGKYKQIIIEKVDRYRKCFESNFGPSNPSECEIIGNELENPEMKGLEFQRKFTNSSS